MAQTGIERRAEDLSATAVRVQEFMVQGGQTVRMQAEMPPIDERIRIARVLFEECVETIRKGLGICIVRSERNDIDINSVEDVRFGVVPGVHPDFEQIIDGAADVNYVTQSIFAACGVADVPVMREVCRSNLTKFREGWHRREDGKIVKSPLYEPAKYAAVEAFKAVAPRGAVEDKKRPRVFVSNEEVGLAYCGTVGEADLHDGIGHLVEGDLCDLKDGDSMSFSVVIKGMTDAEVEALPEI